VRFLSHAETIRLFQRACVRTGVQIAYSQGFNPHQKMSLIPPRSVGVESDDDLLCLWLKEGQTGIDTEAIKAALPEGIEIISVQACKAKNIPEPVSARYVLNVQGHKINDGVRKHITDVMANDKFIVNRRTGEDSETKPVDVRPFLEAIKAEAGKFIVDCKISPAGTIRIDEILNLLQLKTEDLTGPVRRASVQWKGVEQQP
jgi:radical SAM-linked protein